MKKIITVLLVLTMVIGLVPAFAVSAADPAAEEPEKGLNGTYWMSLAEVENGEPGNSDAWRRIMDWHGKDNCKDKTAEESYQTNEWFDTAIDQMIYTSYKWPTVGNGEYGFIQGWGRDDYKAETHANLGDNEYMVQWTGTMKAANAGTYTFNAISLDNGAVIFVDGEKAFEWWGPASYFENKNQDKPLLSKYTFTITEEQVGKDIPFEMWFLEMNGGEALSMNITADGTAASAKSLADAGFTFALSATYYTCKIKPDEHDDIKQYMQDGFGPDGGNNGQADDERNHTFSEEQLVNIKTQMLKTGTSVIPNLEHSAYRDKYVFQQFGALYDDYMVEYSGYVTPIVGGEYQFGTTKVDNCFLYQIKIDGEWKTVYEFWGKGMWNDRGNPTYSADKFNLTAGTSYELRAIFLEIDGGECLDTCVKVNGAEYRGTSAPVIYTTEPYAAGQAPVRTVLFDKGAEWQYQYGSYADGKAPAAPEGFPAAIASTMQTGTAPMNDEWKTSDTDPRDGTQPNAYLWVSKEITVADIDALKGQPLMTSILYDDDIVLYINGTPVLQHAKWSDGYKTLKLADDASSVLKEGKNIISASLLQHHGGWDFDMSLYTTTEDVSSYAVMYANIATADELIAYAKSVNANNANIDNNFSVAAVANITADIDMTGKEWTPIGRWVGIFNGNGHTITGLTYVTEATDNVGLFASEAANHDTGGRGRNGLIRDLTVKDSLLVAKNATKGVGAIVGMCDRGYVTNCAVDNVTVIGGTWAGGIAGRACWGTEGDDVFVNDCTAKNSTVIGNGLAGGIVGTTDSARLIIGDYKVENVIVKLANADKTAGAAIGEHPSDENRQPVIGENKVETNVTLLGADAIPVVAEQTELAWDGNAPTAAKIVTNGTDNTVTAVLVNGKAIAAKYYTLAEADGKLTVTIKDSYLSELDTGSYTFTVASYEGDVNATIAVTEKEAPVTPDIPVTGDMAIVLVIVSILSLGVTAVVSKKRRTAK